MQAGHGEGWYMQRACSVPSLVPALWERMVLHQLYAQYARQKRQSKACHAMLAVAQDTTTDSGTELTLRKILADPIMATVQECQQFL